MAAYATLTQFGLYGLPPATLATVPEDVQTAMLEGASRDVDRMASSFTSTPFVSWGADITQAVCEIAAWKVMTWRGYSPEGDRDPLRERAQAAMAWVLRAGNDGLLPGSVDATPDVHEGGSAVYTSTPRGW